MLGLARRRQIRLRRIRLLEFAARSIPNPRMRCCASASKSTRVRICWTVSAGQCTAYCRPLLVGRSSGLQPDDASCVLHRCCLPRVVSSATASGMSRQSREMQASTAGQANGGEAAPCAPCSTCSVPKTCVGCSERTVVSTSQHRSGLSRPSSISEVLTRAICLPD